MKQIISTTLLASIASSVLAVGGDYNYSSSKAPSTTAPVSNPPQLIVLGSDDNTSAEGVNWIVDYLASKKHADGSDLRMSFYSNNNTSNAWKTSSDDIVVAHKKAYQAGHEVSIHTASHVYFVEGEVAKGDQKRLGLAEGRAEVQNNIDALRDLAGIKEEHMKGFRTPFLAYSDTTFTIVQEKGFTYDCSVNGSTTWGQTSGTAYWPYTLNTDDGEGNFIPDNTAKYNWWNSAHDAPVRQHSGLWELPCNMWNADPVDTVGMDEAAGYETGGKVTALDYNIWAQTGFDKEQSLRTLKYTLDQVYAGNRAPMTIGMHSQYYTAEKDNDPSFSSVPTVADRKYMIEKFIDYALTKGNDIYFVSGAQAIAYCMAPVPASSFDPDDYQWTVPSVDPVDPIIGTEVIDLAGYSAYANDAVVGTAATVTPTTGSVVAEISVVDGNDDSWAGISISLDSSIVNITNIEVTYSADADFTLALPMATTQSDAHIASLPASKSSVSLAVPTAFSQQWGGTDELKLSDVTGLDLGLADGVESGKITITSIKIEGYPEHDAGTVVPADTLELIDGNNASWDKWSAEATIVLDTVAEEFTGGTITFDADATSDAYAGIGSVWIKDENFTFDGVKRIQVVYTSTADFVLNIPMAGVTAENGMAHLIDLAESATSKTVEFGILDSRQPSYASGANVVDLDPTAVKGLEFALLTGETSGKITLESVKLIYSGDQGTPSPVTESLVKATRSTPVVTGITSGQMNLSVPTAGAYNVKFFSVNGRLLSEVSTNLTSGMNSVDLTRSSLSAGMVLVQIKGAGLVSVSKAMIR